MDATEFIQVTLPALVLLIASMTILYCIGRLCHSKKVEENELQWGRSAQFSPAESPSAPKRKKAKKTKKKKKDEKDKKKKKREKSSSELSPLLPDEETGGVVSDDQETGGVVSDDQTFMEEPSEYQDRGGPQPPPLPQPLPVLRRTSKSAEDIKDGFARILEKGFKAKICTENDKVAKKVTMWLSRHEPDDATSRKVWLRDDMLFYSPRTVASKLNLQSGRNHKKRRAFKLDEIDDVVNEIRLDTSAVAKLNHERCFTMFVSEEGQNPVAYVIEMESTKMETVAFVEGFSLLLQTVL